MEGLGDALVDTEKSKEGMRMIDTRLFHNMYVRQICNNLA